MLIQNLARLHLQPDIQRQMHIAVARQQPRERRIPRLMPVSHQRRQFGILIPLQLMIRIVLHQRCIGGVKILARPKSPIRCAIAAPNG